MEDMFDFETGQNVGARSVEVGDPAALLCALREFLDYKKELLELWWELEIEIHIENILAQSV
jgi:hypothetical protein